MHLKDQVCTLAQARRLNELGVSSLGRCFHYTSWPSNPTAQLLMMYGAGTVTIADGIPKDGFDGWIAAFTVAELGLALNVDAMGCLPPGLCGLDKDQWLPDSNEASWRSNLLICLLEKGILNPQTVNKMLSPENPLV